MKNKQNQIFQICSICLVCYLRHVAWRKASESDWILQRRTLFSTGQSGHEERKQVEGGQDEGRTQKATSETATSDAIRKWYRSVSDASQKGRCPRSEPWGPYTPGNRRGDTKMLIFRRQIFSAHTKCDANMRIKFPVCEDLNSGNGRKNWKNGVDDVASRSTSSSSGSM